MFPKIPRAYSAVAALVLTAGSLLAQPLDTVLVLETTPGTEQAAGLIRLKDFPEADRVAVIGFHRAAATVYQSLTDDREKLAEALQRSGTRVGLAIGQGQLPQNLFVDLSSALTKACAEFDPQQSVPERNRAIILLFAGEDQHLASRMEELKARLTSAAIRLYAIRVYRTDQRGAPTLPRASITAPISAKRIEQLAKSTGGNLYPRNWNLKQILTEARKPQ